MKAILFKSISPGRPWDVARQLQDDVDRWAEQQGLRPVKCLSAYIVGIPLRPVDFAQRRRLLDKISEMSGGELAGAWQDGREKLFVAARLLGLRRNYPELFAAGDYQPVGMQLVEGKKRRRRSRFLLTPSRYGVALPSHAPLPPPRAMLAPCLASWGSPRRRSR